jgi:CubicO group peptidase (beta-lactamase class C family)
LHSTLPLIVRPTPDLTYPKIAVGAGFGWEVRDYGGRKLVMHAGSTGTVIGLVPDAHLGIVVLTNGGLGLQIMVMHDIIDRMLGDSQDLEGPRLPRTGD